ncbi:hypothetical protein [Saccharothrix sp. HUAS TT1]|uniref:hypothetical protein n=1 Tax=unclassified Saccharothrix TaxID=2593673 RepID=UPI00345B6B4B
MSVALEAALEAIRGAVYEENERGGEARGIVQAIGRLVGVDLGKDPLDGNVWSPANMRRVVTAVDALRRQNAQLRGLPPGGFAPRPACVAYGERGW